MSQLSHHGVKGMKWGVRRAQAHKQSGAEKAVNRQLRSAGNAHREKKSAREQHKAWKKSANNAETANAVFQDAAKSFNKVMPKLNKDPAFADMATNRNTRRQYDAVVATIFNQHLAQASVNRTHNADINRAMIYQMTPDGRHMRAIEVKQVGHADTSSPDFELIRDEDGFVIDIRLVETSMSQEDLVLAYLAHHGVKGQRWGVRRTKAALARAAKREGRPPASEEHERTKELLKKGKTGLSNKELKEVNERLNLEQNFSRLNQGAASKGKAKTLTTLATISTVAGFLNSPPGKLAIKSGKAAVGHLLLNVVPVRMK